jgi:beta-phosphoglucomutase-like phosphatase (HAD superfamily)
MAVRAILIDFNGTLSDDEPLLCELFQDLFAERGRPLTEAQYYAQLTGLADRDIVRTWLGNDDPDLLSDYARRYVARAGDGSTIPAAAREAVRAAGGVLRLAVVSGAPAVAVEAALEGAGLAGAFAALVTADDVVHGKPNPEGYLLALLRLDVAASEAVAVEDSAAGIAAANAAGIYTVGVLGSAGAGGLEAADEVVDRFDASLVARLLDR